MGSEGRVDEEFYLSARAELLEALFEDATHRDGVDPASGVGVAPGHQGDDGAVVVVGVADRGRVALQLPGDTAWRRSYRYGRLTAAPVRPRVGLFLPR